MKSRPIVAYYDRLAATYDADRFGNSYGQFLDQQERAILARFLPRNAERVLDLGCGTGRLSDRASQGCDASLASLHRAAAKHPAKSFVAADAAALPFASGIFDAALSFHVFMHIEKAAIAASFAEIARVLRPGGVFVADVASQFRRRLGRRRASGWHGSTSLSRAEFAALAAHAGLAMEAACGVMIAPIHRLPDIVRAPMVHLDRRLAGWFPDAASYIVGRFVKAAHR